MLTACNKANQNFIIDEKFPELIVQVLKIYRLNSLRKGLLVKQHLTETRVKSDEVDNNFPVEQIAPKDNKERS